MSYFKSVGKEENMYLAIGILGLCVSGAFGIYLDGTEMGPYYRCCKCGESDEDPVKPDDDYSI